MSLVFVPLCCRGEDPYYTDERICEIVSGIKAKYPDCAVTLSIGEKSKESYQSYLMQGRQISAAP